MTYTNEVEHALSALPDGRQGNTICGLAITQEESHKEGEKLQNRCAITALPSDERVTIAGVVEVSQCEALEECCFPLNFAPQNETAIAAR